MTEKPLPVAALPFLQPAPRGERVYGVLRLQGADWLLEAEPMVIEFARRLFRNTRSLGKQTARFSSNRQTIADLNWLMLRFPLRVENTLEYEALLADARRHQDRLDDVFQKPSRITPNTISRLLPYQEEGVAFLHNNRRSLLADEPGLGKAQPMDAKVLTPKGYVRMGDLLVGSEVCDPVTGRATRVVDIFPQGRQYVFRIVFTDGTSTECTADHLWVANTRDRIRREDKALVWTTRQLSDMAMRNPVTTNEWILPHTKPLRMVVRDLPVHPYVMGVLCARATVCIGPTVQLRNIAAIAKPFKELLPRGVQLVRIGKRDNYRLREKTRGKPFYALLKKLGILTPTKDREIPEAYLLGKPESRTEFLQGYLDARGSFRATPGVDLVRVHGRTPKLDSQLRMLIHTLGGEAVAQDKKRITIRLPPSIDPFKHNAEKAAQVQLPRRVVKYVEYVGDKICQCIKVKSKHGLYITDDGIVTHNTAQAIGFLVHAQAFPCLIVMPPHLMKQWPEEIRKFLGNVCVIRALRGRKARPVEPAHIYITHYQLLPFWQGILQGLSLSTIIFDEVQELRHPEAKKYNAASAITALAQNVIGLSGTPIYNHGIEIWSVMNILDHGCLGTKQEFLDKWCNRADGVVADPHVLGSHLRREGMYFRRVKEQVLIDLPPKRKIVHEIGMDTSIYGPLINKAIAFALRARTAQDEQTAMRLNHIALENARHATGMAKSRYVAAFVQTLLEAGEPVLLFCHHLSVVEDYCKRLAGWRPVVISGQISSVGKNEAVKKFQSGHTNLCVITMRSGGTGLNLQRARCVVFGELDFTPAVHTQCEDRAHRIGIKNSVLVYYLVTPRGSDKEIQECLGLKETQFVGIMGDRHQGAQDAALAAQSSQKHMKKLLVRLGRMTPRDFAPEEYEDDWKPGDDDGPTEAETAVEVEAKPVPVPEAPKDDPRSGDA